ncbi:hypothetical protein JNW90_26080 [Micromonospora sp. STR1s_5]|nr:hypothetical protein [Micromonospora sp. STR1s_5]
MEAQFQARRDALQPRYGQEIAKARPLDVPETAALWDLSEQLARDQKGPGRGMLEQAIDLVAPRNARGLRVPDATPEGLMQTRQALDGMIARATENADLRTAGVAMRLQQIRQAVDDTVRVVNPEIKNLDRAYETFSDASAAFRNGQNFLGRDQHPVDIATRFNAAPMEQQAAERLGARARIDREVGNTANDLTALKQVVKGEGDWNRAKLATYFGPEEADRIIGAVDREAAFRDVFNKVVENSQTAQRAAGARAMGVRELRPEAGDLAIPVAGAAGGPMAAAGAAGWNLARRGANAIGRDADVARNNQLAQILMQSGPERDATVIALADALASRQGGRAASDHVNRLAQMLLTSEGRQEPVTDQARVMARALARR